MARKSTNTFKFLLLLLIVTDMLADDPFEIFLVMLSEKKLKVKARISFDCKGIAEFK